MYAVQGDYKALCLSCLAVPKYLEHVSLASLFGVGHDVLYEVAERSVLDFDDACAADLGSPVLKLQRQRHGLPNSFAVQRIPELNGSQQL